MKPYKPDWYGRLKTGPFAGRPFAEEQMARVEERLRRGDRGGRQGVRMVAWSIGVAAVCAIGLLLMVRVGDLGPVTAVKVTPPPSGTIVASPTPPPAVTTSPQLSEAEAVQVAKQHNADPTVQWTATLDPSYKSDDPAQTKPLAVWRVEGVYPAGNKDIFFIDAATGNVLANSEIEAPPVIDQAKSIEQMRMLDEAHGWSLNALGVWHTSSGAEGWTNVAPKGVTLTVSGNSFNLPRIAIVDDKSVVLAVPNPKSPVITVYRTADSGKTWNNSSFKSGWSDQDVPAIRKLTFVDGTHGWMLISYGAAAGSEQVALYATTDGGANWKLASGNDPGKPLQPNEIPYSGDKSGLAFADRKMGYLSGFSAAPGPYFYGTTDGGLSWNQIKLTLPDGIDPFMTSTLEPTFVSSSNGWLAVPFTTSDSQRRMLIYTTGDGGRSWKAGVTVPSFAEREPVMSFVNDKTAYLTDGTQWYKIGNGGTTIDSWKLTDKRLSGIRSLQFLTEQVGYAAMDNRVWITRDGGHTWNVAW